MAFITLKDENLPGILGLLIFKPETSKPLTELAEVLLRGPSTLSRGEREIIASSVSHWNNCHFCHTSHGAAAASHLNSKLDLIDDIKAGLIKTPVTPKLKSLLNIAHKVQQSGKNVTKEDVDIALKQGATELEVHDTVLISAAFCMYNRYVDGLGTWAPDTIEDYRAMGNKIAREGYLTA